MSYKLTSSKINPDRVRHIGVPAVCCVMGCKKAPVMSQKLVNIKAWASLCEQHYQEAGRERTLDMAKMFSVEKANKL